jgi:hypothetical protein
MKILTAANSVSASPPVAINGFCRISPRWVKATLTGTSGSVQLQGRMDPNDTWINLGTAFTATGLQAISLMPQVRFNITAISAATFDAWVDAYSV